MSGLPDFCAPGTLVDVALSVLVHEQSGAGSTVVDRYGRTWRRALDGTWAALGAYAESTLRLVAMTHGPLRVRAIEPTGSAR